MPPITVAIARASERVVIENLMQLYVHDFSEFWRDKPQGELDRTGRFADAYPLDGYWRDQDRVPLLLWRGESLAGFALLNGHAHSGLTTDQNMAEFFVVRKHRLGGVGMAAANAIFALYPGLWETAVARANLPALAFWRRVAAQHTEIEELDVTTEAWNGPILRFRAG